MAKAQYSISDESLFQDFDGFTDFKTLESWGEQKDYKWTALLYPDCTTYFNGRDVEGILNIVRNWGWQEWQYIKHDRDLFPDGRPKKAHYHVVIKTAPTQLKTVARILGIPQNYVQRVKSWKKMNQYLLHDECRDKIEYTVEEVISSDSQNYLSYFDSSTEEEDAQKILDYILQSGCQSFIQLMEWCCKNGLYATCRRNAGMWSNCIREMQKYGVKE